MRLSIIRRTVAIVFAGLVLLTLGFWAVLHARLHRDVETILTTRTRSAMALIVTDGGRLGVEETPLDEGLESSFWLFDSGGRAVATPAAGKALQRAAVELVGTRSSAEVDGARLQSTPVVIDGRPAGTLVVGVALSPFTSSEHVSLGAAGLLDLLILLGTLSLTNRTMLSALKPVEQMTVTAARWSRHDLDRRFADSGEDDELAHLAGTLNSLLGQLGGLVRHEQRVTGDIAHELKTPLARMQSSAELALAYGSDEDKNFALMEVMAESLHLADVIDDLLICALADGSPGRCDAALVVHEEVGRLNAPGITIELRTASAHQVGCDAPTLARMLSPLTANALKHAVTKVVIGVTRCDDRIVIDVFDDGSGFLEAELRAVFRPGFRGEQAQGMGSGLGMALAQRLAASAAGRVEAIPGDGGHTRISLPAG